MFLHSLKKMTRTCAVVLFCLLVTYCTANQRCSSIGDCKCGMTCLNSSDRRCEGEQDCTCKPGCTIFDVYLKPGQSKRVYGNLCSCPAVCTRVAWMGNPDIPPYENNPNC